MIDVRNGISHRCGRADLLAALENIDTHFLTTWTKVKADFNIRLNKD